MMSDFDSEEIIEIFCLILDIINEAANCVVGATD
jgi:hypothetical protein